MRLPPRKQPRCAFLEGFSLHANTHLHANDRQGLERLRRYGACGALALERLSRAEDGRIAYRMKRPLPDGTTHLLFTGLTLLRRLASLVPSPRANLTRFHGVFAPGAKVRPFLLPQAGAEPGLEKESPAFAATVEEPRKERTPRLDWAGAAEKDVHPGCVRVLEVWRQAASVGVREASRRGESDSGAPGHAHGECVPGPCARATPERVVLKLKPPQPAKRTRPLPRTSWEGGLGRRVFQGAARLLHPPGVLPGRPRQRPSSAPALQRSPSTWPLSRLCSARGTRSRRRPRRPP
ncbi:transposase [Corallococcus exercitus]|uniref:transposase n=1 Tax=Corallococcus exercitus TaxID=2316736 RepID=UPI00300D8C9A